MTDNLLKYGAIDTNDLTVNENELRARLKCPPSELTLVYGCTEKLKTFVRCRYAYRFTDIKRFEHSIDLGFGELTSKNLCTNLNGCEYACILAVTLGSDIDRHLIKLSYLSPSEHFITDAVASALAEDACDKAEKLIVGEAKHRPRYSPGYGDLTLECQKPLLSFLDAQRTVGITLSDTLIMSPSKSITAIIGIKK